MLKRVHFHYQNVAHLIIVYPCVGASMHLSVGYPLDVPSCLGKLSTVDCVRLETCALQTVLDLLAIVSAALM